MTLYEALKFVHITSIIVWLGAGFLVHLMLARTVRATDAAAAENTLSFAAWSGPRVASPAGGVAFATGLWMTLDSWSFAETWISIGLTIFIVSSVTGMAFLGPRIEKLQTLVADGITEEFRGRLSSVLRVFRVDLLLLLTVVAVMVAKP